MQAESTTPRSRRASLPPSRYQQVFALWGEQCLACGRTEYIEVDHVIPPHYGGTNDLDNLQPLCRSCNTKKYRHNIIDFRTDTPEARALRWKLVHEARELQRYLDEIYHWAQDNKVRLNGWYWDVRRRAYRREWRRLGFRFR